MTQANKPHNADDASRRCANSLKAPVYDRAYDEFYRDAAMGAVSDDRILGDIETYRTRHAGPMRNVRGSIPLDQPMQKGAAVFALDRADIVSCNIDAHALSIHQTVEELIAAQKKAFFAGISEVSDAVGTTVTGQPNVPNLETFRELLRRMEFDFNEDGTVSDGLRLYVAPESAAIARALVKSASDDPECRAIIDEKRRVWLELRAKKSNRKLSR